MDLKPGRPEEAGFSLEGLQRGYDLLQKAVADRVFPGAVVLIARGGWIVGHRALGRFTYDEKASPVQPDTLFDLASVTKVVATTTAAMLLVEEGALDLDQRVAAYLPSFGGNGKADITVRHLLTHTSGLPSWVDLYRWCTGKQAAVDYICAMELNYPPGTQSIYSDLGVITLGAVLEQVSGLPLDPFCHTRIFAPLSMRETLFNPPRSLWSRIAPTEYVEGRGGVVQGQVHDENAFAMGGVAPHAGLFSTAGDLGVFCQMFLNGGVYGSQRILREETIRLFTRRQNVVPESHRALGWAVWSAESSAGKRFSPSSYGHTGFTGTSLWIDPERSLFVVLLTHRVHSTRDNTRILQLRPYMHDTVIEAMGEEEGDE